MLQSLHFIAVWLLGWLNSSYTEIIITINSNITITASVSQNVLRSIMWSKWPAKQLFHFTTRHRILFMELQDAIFWQLEFDQWIQIFPLVFQTKYTIMWNVQVTLPCICLSIWPGKNCKRWRRMLACMVSVSSFSWSFLHSSYWEMKRTLKILCSIVAEDFYYLFLWYKTSQYC